jgi:hypothetical protein
VNVFDDGEWELEAEHLGARRRSVAKPAGERETGASGFHLHSGAAEGLVKMFDLGDT